LRGQVRQVARKLAGQAAIRAANRSLGARIDQVGHRFCLRQIESVVQERAAREFARLGQPGPERATGLQATR